MKSDAEIFVGTADEKLRATGIYVNNGSMTVEAGASVSVYSQIDSAWKWVDADGSPQETFNQYNGVYVQGGSLACYGELNVDHTGVESDVQSGSADRMYRDYIVKSYAVRVENAGENAGENAVVEIDGGAIPERRGRRPVRERRQRRAGNGKRRADDPHERRRRGRSQRNGIFFQSASRQLAVRLSEKGRPLR